MDERPPRKRKLFVGIPLDAQARAACAAVAKDFRKTGLAAKYEAPEKLHATLAFLGFVEPPRVEEVTAPMAACAQRSQPFRVTLDKLGAFPHERKPRVVYVGAREQGAPFRELAGAVRAAYVDLGFSFKDDSVVHVTIARVKEPRRALPLIDVTPARLVLGELALFESIFDKERNTSRYEIRARAALRG